MLIIQEAKSDQIPFIVESQLAMALETESLKLDLKTVQLGVSVVFQDPKKGKYYIAQEGEQNLGCLLTIPEWSDWRNGDILWIHSVYVVPEARGKGVYKKMYEYLQKKVRNENLRGLRLYVDKKNTRAQEVYAKLGMTNEHYDLFEWMKS